MQRWKERGFVQDSDEEEESSSFDTSNSSFKSFGQAAIEDIDGQTSQDGPRLHQNKEKDATDALCEDQFTGREEQDAPGDVTDTDQTVIQELPESNARQPGSAEESIQVDDQELPIVSPPKDQDEALPLLSTDNITTLNAAEGTGYIHAGFSDISSSPLSEALSLPSWDDELEINLRLDFLASEKAKEVRQSSTAVPGPEPSMSVEESIRAELANVYRIERSLRQRNPIQLHPYLIENERYRKFLSARGVKPVRIPNTTRSGENNNQENETQEDDTQEDKTQEGSNMEETQVYAPSDDQPSSPPPHHGFLSSSISPFHASRDEDEFPSIDALLNRRIEGGMQAGHKRRKTKHYSSKGKKIARQIEANESDNLDIYQIPQSPPEQARYQRNRVSDAHESGFRMPPFLSPTVDYTPPTSVATARPTLRDAAHGLSDDDLPPQSGRRNRLFNSRTNSVTILSSSESESSSEDSRSEQSGQLKRTQRRIRGVLPASWLTLDQQAQQRPRKQNDDVPSEVHRQTGDMMEPQKGVAKKIRKNTGNNPATSTMLNFGDSLDLLSDESDASNPAPVNPGQQHDSINSFNEIDGVMPDVDEMEDDWIDPILPSHSRESHSGSKPKVPRQTKLRETFMATSKGVKGIQRHMGDSHDASRTKKSKPSSRKKQGSQRQPKPNIPRLSILDAPERSPHAATPVPDFIKLARRQAKKLPKEGRHSPSRKYIRLQTGADTEEANSVLNDWKGSKIRQRRYPAIANNSEGRAPLADRHLNQQTLPNPIQGDATSSKNSGDELQVLRVRNLTLPPRTKQTRLTPLAVKKAQTRDDYEPIGKPSPKKPRAPIFRRQLEKQHIYRPGALEGLESDFNVHHRRAAFQKTLGGQQVNFMQRLERSQIRSLQLERFLADDDPLAVNLPLSKNPAVSDNETTARLADNKVGLTQVKKRHRRKLQPKRLDVEVREYRQPSEPTIITEIQENPTAAADNDSGKEYLTGLGPYGTCYPTDFDARPLEFGTFFHQSTLIGSGEFQHSLNFKGRDLDVDAGLFHHDFPTKNVRWGCWTEEVSSEVVTIIHSLTKELEGHISTTSSDSTPHGILVAVTGVAASLQGFIKYFSGWLSFLDPPDRAIFVSRILDQLHMLSRTILSMSVVQSESRCLIIQHQAGLLNLLLVLSNQVKRISEHPSVMPTTTSEATALLSLLAEALMNYCLDEGSTEIIHFLEESRRHVVRTAGIHDGSSALHSVVLLWHILRLQTTSLPSFWQLFNSIREPQLIASTNLSVFERAWKSIFTMVPLIEFDNLGVATIGARYKESLEDWSLVKIVLNRLFTLYPDTSLRSSSSINDYVRVTLIRCHRLLHNWGWRRCESMLKVIFDFFARNGLAPLRNEECHGSPRFLDDIDKRPSLQVLPEDKSFHIFLKLLATGLQNMQSVYTDKQISGIAYRFLPNHGRTHRKDSTLRQEDIDALRNHHDLLSTLYWASPSGHRPKLTLLRNLVDHSTSHREACRVNVRTWTRLVTYQLSTNEPAKELEPFAAWCHEIIKPTITQFKLARTEAEGQYNTAKAQGDTLISFGLVESTISRNQSQVAATLVDLLAGMKRAFQSAHDQSAASIILQQSTALDVFKLFDPKMPLINDVLIEALNVIGHFISIGNSNSKPSDVSQNTSDESQDYGDFPEFDDPFPMDIEMKDPSPSPIEFIQESVAQLLSSCFGAETSPSDKLLVRLVDTWVDISTYQVKSGYKVWDDYLDRYSPLSWHRLSDTEHKRRYEPYFLACLLEVDPTSYQGQENNFMTSWMLSLVERESMLKYQYRLTNALINLNQSNTLLTNLPFITSTASNKNKADITPREFRERRLVLVSTILSNMRIAFESTLHNSPSKLPELRREYSELLKQFTAAMKKTYLGLQQSSTIKGAYVSFVQKVVEFFQQYTSDICPIDKFFTDSSAFPLPATDPTYVVGRLKSFGLKLNETKTMKQLVIFMQTVSERAATDGQQEYLVGQLRASTTGTYEYGSLKKPSLRRVLLQAVFPAYIQSSLRTTSGWIMGRPILQASIFILRDLPYQFSITDTQSLQSVRGMITDTLATFRGSVELLVESSDLLAQPHILQILAFIFRSVTALMPCLDYIHRRTLQCRLEVQLIDFFKEFSLFIAEMVLYGSSDLIPHMELDRPAEGHIPEPANFGEIRQLCTRELNRALATEWRRNGDSYVLQKGAMKWNVLVHTGTTDQEKESVITAIEDFHAILQRMSGLNREPYRPDRVDALAFGFSDLII